MCIEPDSYPDDENFQTIFLTNLLISTSMFRLYGSIAKAAHKGTIEGQILGCLYKVIKFKTAAKAQLKIMIFADYIVSSAHEK